MREIYINGEKINYQTFEMRETQTDEMSFVDVDGIRMDYRNIAHWTGCPHKPKTKVKSLEFYEDVIRRAIVCELVLSDRKPVIGIARCHPKDEYSETLGRKMALTKAMADMSRETRAIVWKYYFRKIAKE